MTTPALLPFPIPSDRTELPFGGQVSLWAVRMWTKVHREGDARKEAVRHAFTLIGAPRAYDVLDRLLSIVTHHGRCAPEIRRPHHRSLSADEITLLQALAAAQRGTMITAYGAFSAWIIEALIRHAMSHVAEYSNILHHKGLFLLNESRAKECDIRTLFPSCVSFTIH